MEVANKWRDYQLIDAGDKDKLERWGDVTLIRPDPQAIWHKQNEKLWQKYDARYLRSNSGGGHWEYKKSLPSEWQVSYGDLKFKVAPTNFKHTGLFPEQAINWDWLQEKIKNSDHEVKALNLFAYTGAATMACAKAGAKEVVHVDASKGMINWAKENMVLNDLQDKTIKFYVDDVNKLIQREIRRGNKYDIIIMDPPSYGRGPNKEVWQLEDQLENLIEEASKLLSENPVAFLVNGYTTGFSSAALKNIMMLHLLDKYPSGKVYTIELGLPIGDTSLVLPCGISGRFEW